MIEARVFDTYLSILYALRKRPKAKRPVGTINLGPYGEVDYRKAAW